MRNAFCFVIILFPGVERKIIFDSPIILQFQKNNQTVNVTRDNFVCLSEKISQAFMHISAMADLGEMKRAIWPARESFGLIFKYLHC